MNRNEELLEMLNEQGEVLKDFKARHLEKVAALERQVRDLETKANRPGLPNNGNGFDRGTKSPEVKAFENLLRTGIASPEQLKAMSIGSAGDGGYTVPQDLERQIFEMAKNAAPMAGLVRQVPASTDAHEIVVNTGGLVASWVSETAARTNTTTPTLAKVTLAKGELYALPAITQRLLDDANTDLASWLAREIGLVFGLSMDLGIISGTGSDQIKGVLQHTLAATPDSSRAFGTVEKMHSGVSADFDADDLIDLEAKLKPQYRQNAAWVMASATWSKIRKLKDATTGQYLIGDLVGAAPRSLLGHPVVLDENVPAIAASSHSVLIGDWQAAYTLATVRGTRVMPDPYTNRPYVNIYATHRVAGDVVDSAAVKVLTLAV